MAMTGLTKFYTELNKGVGAAARIWEILDKPLSIPVDSGIIPTEPIKGMDLNYTFFIEPNKNQTEFSSFSLLFWCIRFY